MKTFLVHSIGFLAVLASADLAQAACGKVEIAKGKVQITTSAGKASQASVGSGVCSGDTVTAGPDSRAKIKMEDGNELNVSPDTKIVLETYEYQPSENKKKVLLNVLKGKVRATTKEENMYNGKGKDGQANFFQVKTKSAVAGVRGTDFLTSFNPATNKSEVVTFKGQVAFGQPGPGGQIVNPVMVNAGQKTEMSAGQPPASPKPVPAAELESANRESRGEPVGAKGPDEARGDGSKSDEKKSDDKAASEDRKKDDDKSAREDKKTDDRKSADEKKSNDDKKSAGEPKADDKKSASEPKADDKKSAGEPKADDKKSAGEPKADDKKSASEPKADDKKSAGEPKAGDKKSTEAKTNEPKQAAANDGKNAQPAAGNSANSDGSKGSGQPSSGTPAATGPNGSTSGGQAAGGGTTKGPTVAQPAAPPRTPTSIPSGSLLNDRDLGGGAGTVGSVPNLPKIPGSQFQVPVPVIPTVPVCDQCNAARTNSRVNITIKY